MNIEEVRRNFQKASFVVSPNRLSIVYGNWDTRYSDGVDPRVLSDLIHDSSAVLMENCGNTSVKITFCMETGETKNVIYPHMKDEMSLEELKSLTVEPREGGFADYLPDNCAELDFSEILEYARKFAEDAQERLPDVQTDENQWNLLLTSALKFATSIGAESEIVNPDRKTFGIVTVFALEEPRKILRLEGKRKDLFEEAARNSFNVGLEIGPTEGIAYWMFSMPYD